MLAVMKIPGAAAVNCVFSGKEQGVRLLLGERETRRVPIRCAWSGEERVFVMYIRADQERERCVNIIIRDRMIRGPILVVEAVDGKARALDEPTADEIRAKLDELDAVKGPKRKTARTMRRHEREGAQSKWRLGKRSGSMI